MRLKYDSDLTTESVDTPPVLPRGAVIVSSSGKRTYTNPYPDMCMQQLPVAVTRESNATTNSNIHTPKDSIGVGYQSDDSNFSVFNHRKEGLFEKLLEERRAKERYVSVNTLNGVPKTNKMRRRHWMVTYYGEDAQYVDVKYIQDAIEYIKTTGSTITIVYAIWQLERCPSTDKDHVQAYFEFSASVYKTWISKLFKHKSKLFAEPRMHERVYAIDYCKKERSRIAGPYTIGATDEGVPAFTPSPGQRNDINSIHELISKGAGMEEILEHHPSAMLRMPAGIKTAMAVVRQRDAPVHRDVEVIVLFGKTGTGKTSGVLCGDESVYVADSSMLQANTGNLWWDGYAGEDNVIFDDYNDWFHITDLLKYCDRYTIRIQSKGSSTMGYWKRLFITSNKPPWEWKNRGGAKISEEHKAALQRRLHTIAKVANTRIARGTILYKHKGRLINRPQIVAWIGEHNVKHYERLQGKNEEEDDDNSDLEYFKERGGDYATKRQKIE